MSVSFSTVRPQAVNCSRRVYTPVSATQIRKEKPATRSQHPADLGEKGVHGFIAV
jgi:hypothetical protein